MTSRPIQACSIALNLYWWKDIRDHLVSVTFWVIDIWCVDTIVVPIWSEQPHYKHHSIRLKCEVRVTCLLQWKGGGGEWVCRYNDKRPKKWSENVVQVSDRSIETVRQSSKKRWQQSVRYMRNMSENEDDKGRNEIWGQYTIVWLKGELSVLFGSGGNKKHKYSYNNRMKHWWVRYHFTCLNR